MSVAIMCYLVYLVHSLGDNMSIVCVFFFLQIPNGAAGHYLLGLIYRLLIYFYLSFIVNFHALVSLRLRHIST